MIKSKHFRKDVIIARVIFLCLCILLIVGVWWLVSKLTGTSKPGDSESQHSESQNSEYLDSESERESESESVSELESESESESASELESESESEVESETTTESNPLPKYVQVTARNLRLRAEPNTNCDTITSLDKGEKAQVLDYVDGWYKVSYKGNEGYLSADHVKAVEE